MTELFTELPIEVKNAVTSVIDVLLQKYEIKDCINIVVAFINSTEDPIEKDFIQFYFSLKMEQLNNESNINQR